MSKSYRSIRPITVLLAVALTVSSCSRLSNKSRIRERADKYFKAGDYDKARVEYLNLLRADNQNVVAIQQLGFIWLEEGAPLRAIPFLRRMREIAPQNIPARSKLALAYLTLGDSADARKEAMGVLQQDPTNSDSLIILCDTSQSKEEIAAAEQQLEKFPDKDKAAFHIAAASLATRKGEASNAAEQMQQALAADPKSARAHLLTGYFYFVRGNPTHAESELKTAADLAPPRSEEKIKYAEFKAANRGLEEAKTALTAITRETPDYLPAWRDLAQIALTEKKYDEGLSLLENVLSRDADNPEAKVLQSILLMAKGDSKKALAVLDRVNSAYPGNPMVKLQLARAYLQNNDIGKATTALEQAIAAKPNYTDAILALAEVNLRSGKVQAGVAAIEGLLRNQPRLANLIQAQTLLISGYQALGRLDEAAALCRDQIKRAPESAQGYYMLGLILHQQQKDDEAKAALEKAAELAPGDFNTIEKLIELDLAAKNYDAATQRVEQELQRNPNAPGPHFLEAKIYLAHGTQRDISRAEAAFQKAIELDPNFTPAYDGLVSIYIAQNKSSEALNQLKAELGKNPKNPRALLVTAMIYERMKDYPSARDSYEKLLAVDAGSILALNNLAYLYAERLNDLNKAYELGKKVRDLRPTDGMVADTFGWILYKRRDYQQAVSLLQESAQKFPENAEVQFHLGMAQYMMGNTDAARTALEKAVHTETDFTGKDEAQRRLTALQSSSSGKTASTNDLQSQAKQQPNDVIALQREAEAYEKQGDNAKAAATYEQVFKLNPKLPATCLKLARLYGGPLHNPDKAIEYARKARDLAPNDPQIGAAVGRIALQCEKFDWAYSLLQEGTLRAGGDPAVLHDFAMANYALGKISDARRIMQQAMGANPGAPESEDGKRFLAMTAAEPPSQAEIQAALKTEPDYVPALMAEAAVALQQNDGAKAASNYQSVLKKYSNFAPAQKQLAAIYASDSGKLKQAYDLAIKARKAMPDDPELSRTLAELSFKRNEFPYAAQLFQESAAKQPLPAIDLYYLGMAQLQSRQEPKGRETLQKALTAGLEDPFAQEAKKRLAEQAK